MFKLINKESRDNKKRIIKAIKNDDTIVIFTEDNVTGNATKGSIVQMLALGLEKLVDTGILEKEDIKLIYNFAIAKNEDEKEKIIHAFEEDMLDKLLSDKDKDENVNFKPKKKRGRPRKSV